MFACYGFELPFIAENGTEGGAERLLYLSKHHGCRIICLKSMSRNPSLAKQLFGTTGNMGSNISLLPPRLVSRTEDSTTEGIYPSAMPILAWPPPGLLPLRVKRLFGYAILGFALTEAIASFAPMMAFLLLFSGRTIVLPTEPIN